MVLKTDSSFPTQTQSVSLGTCCVLNSECFKHSSPFIPVKASLASFKGTSEKWKIYSFISDTKQVK